MSTVPKNRSQRVQFFESHVAIWKANAAALGLEVGPVDELKTLITSTRADVTAQESAQDAARAATETLNLTDGKMTRKGAEIIKRIQFHAEDTKNPNVYVLAQIPAPKKPSPLPAPGKPSNLSVALGAGGALELGWQCRNPAGSGGTMYEIRRQDESGASVHLTTIGDRKFTDRTVPAGSSRLTYTITAIRSTKRGPEAQFLVKFGSSETGTAPAVQKQVDKPKRKVA